MRPVRNWRHEGFLGLDGCARKKNHLLKILILRKAPHQGNLRIGVGAFNLRRSKNSFLVLFFLGGGGMVHSLGHLRHFDVKHPLEGGVGPVEGKGQGGGVARVLADVDVHWKGIGNCVHTGRQGAKKGWKRPTVHPRVQPANHWYHLGGGCLRLQGKRESPKIS